MERWDQVAISPADILLPGPGVDLNAWAVVACDQYTSQLEYWQAVDETVNGKPSALRITLPEIFLHDSGRLVPKIHHAMAEYLDKNILVDAVKNGFIITERMLAGGPRIGLIAALDLESYDYSESSRSMVRATEGTILSRIPPRLAVRRGAPLECPHVLLLLDDIEKTVLEPVYASRHQLSKLYDFELMAKGGHVRGWAVTDPELKRGIYHALVRLKQKLPGDNPLLMAVGDGNHSLATARAYWSELKKTLTSREAACHPARYALVELENIHDAALEFHPIHRVLFHAGGDEVLRDFGEYLNIHGMEMSYLQGRPGDHRITVLYGGKEIEIFIHRPDSSLAVGTLQKYLDNYLLRHREAEIDYIHGGEAVRSLCAKGDTAGFLVPGLEKSSLLPAVLRDGALPRKTFSMGEAYEKRYYLECRKIL